jgi:peptidoglycan-associated lipoprotein
VAAIAPEDQVFFAFDSVTLDRSMQSILDDVAVWVRADPARTLLVQGHADRAGAASYNLDLSTRRAQAVGRLSARARRALDPGDRGREG